MEERGFGSGGQFAGIDNEPLAASAVVARTGEMFAVRQPRAAIITWAPIMAKTSSSPNGKKMKRKRYEKELQRLQGELCKLQEWVKYKRHRVIIVFEGRDAAGKGGTIKAITER